MQLDAQGLFPGIHLFTNIGSGQRIIVLKCMMAPLRSTESWDSVLTIVQKFGGGRAGQPIKSYTLTTNTHVSAFLTNTIVRKLFIQTTHPFSP